MGIDELRYPVYYSPDARDHLGLLTRRQQTIIVDSVEQQLTRQPLAETRNRKPMRPNPLAPWELRIGNLRVYYEVMEEAEARVHILAIGIKERNRVRVGTTVIEL